MKPIFLLMLYVGLFVNTSGQSFKYRKYNFEWKPGRPEAIPVSDQFKNEDAVILDEKMIYDIGGNRVPPYYFLNQRANYFYVDQSTNGVSPIVQKHVRIKYLTTNGVKKHSTFVLPESYDPASDWSTVRPELRDSIYRPKGEFECVRYFAARILHEDGTIGNAILEEKTQMELNRHNQINSKLFNWIFRVINLEPGDELELDYSYEGAFNIDPSTRIFFNGDLPKQNFHLTVRYPEEEYYVITYGNGARPDDSIMVSKNYSNGTEFFFSKKDLPGGLRECGGRPYTQYPYITYYRHQREYGLMDPKTKFISLPLPYPWGYIAVGLAGYQYENLKMRLSRMDNATRMMNEFVQQERSKSPDTTLASIMNTVQHTLAQNFEYQRDNEYFEGDGKGLERLGHYVENKTLREISRIRFYDEVLTRLDRDYFAALFCDKRIALIDMNEYRRSTSFRIAYAVVADKSVLYYYPKSYRFGYEANELPFYYEDIQTLLIPQHVAVDEKYNYVPEVSSTFVITPFSSVKENIRITSAKVNVALEAGTIDMNARITLSGQFSTLTRGFYIYGDKDTTINPMYYHSLRDVADFPEKATVNVTHTSTQYPFEATVTMALSSKTRVEKTASGTFEIDLSDWFNNVIDEDFSAINRHLNYYPDFQFQDSHKYMIQCDKKIKVENADVLKKTISNGFAEYSVNVTQSSEDMILIESSYIVKPEYAPANHAADVQQVFDAIRNLNSASLVVKPL